MEPNPEIPGLFDLALVNFPSADVSNLVAGLKGRGIVISNWADPYDNDGSVGLDITAVPRLEELVGDIPVPNGMVEQLEDLVGLFFDLAGGNEAWIDLRVQGSEEDYLYSIPPPPRHAPAVRSLLSDLRQCQPDGDGFRDWYRGRWMGHEELWADEAARLDALALTPERIVDLCGRSGYDEEFPDWRPVHHAVSKRATCADLVKALGMAGTSQVKWRLCYAISRGRGCRRSADLLLDLLNDPCGQVRSEAVDAIGTLMFRIPPPPEKLAERVATALIEHLANYPGDSHFFTLTVLGATRSSLAKSVLLDQLANPDSRRREASAQGLKNLGSPTVLPNLKAALEREQESSVVRRLRDASSFLESAEH